MGFFKKILIGLIVLALGIIVFVTLKNQYAEKKVPRDLIVHFSTENLPPWASNADYIANFSFKNAIHTRAALPSPNRKQNSIKSVEIVKNNIVEIEIADDLYFERGDEEWKATTEDVKFTLIRTFLISKDRNRFKDIFYNIKGFDELDKVINKTHGLLDGRAIEISGIKILSPTKIRIEVKKDFGKFNRALFELGFYILSPKCFEKDLNIVKGLPCGTGPYKVTAYDKKTSEVRLELRKRFLDDYPKAPKGVVMVTDESNRGDLFWKDMWNIDKSLFEQRIIKNPLGTLGFFFNQKTKLGRSEKFRDAVAAALKRTELVEGFPYLIPNDEIIPKGKSGHITFEGAPDSQYNPERAKKIIKKYFSGRIEVDCEVYGQTDYEMKKTNFTKIKDQLKKVGIIINFKKPSDSIKFQTPLFIAGIALQNFNNPSFVYSFFRPGSIFDNAYPKNDRKFNKLFDRIEVKNSDSLSDISYYFSDKNYMVPLWDLYSNYLYRKGLIRSLGSQRGGLSFHIARIIMEEN